MKSWHSEKKTIYYLESAKTKEYKYTHTHNVQSRKPQTKNCLVEQQKEQQKFNLGSACLADCLRVPGNLLFVLICEY